MEAGHEKLEETEAAERTEAASKMAREFLATRLVAKLLLEHRLPAILLRELAFLVCGWPNRSELHEGLAKLCDLATNAQSHRLDATALLPPKACAIRNEPRPMPADHDLLCQDPKGRRWLAYSLRCWSSTVVFSQTVYAKYKLSVPVLD